MALVLKVNPKTGEKQFITVADEPPTKQTVEPTLEERIKALEDALKILMLGG